MNSSKKLYFLSTLLLLSIFFLGGCTSADNENTKLPNEQQSQNSAESSSPSATKSEQTNSQEKLLNQILELAQQGKIINCQFPVKETVIDTVKEKWGEPDKEDYIAMAKGTYATYNQHNVVFGFNKGMQIFDVRSYDSELKHITMSKVKDVLGEPEKINHYNSEDMLVYQAGENYQLLFMFLKATQENPNPKLDHYNVFYPHGTVNSMADDPGIKY